MASEIGTSMPASKWSDLEKIALLVSVIKTSGVKVKWADVAVPAGRTTQSSAKLYGEMMKASAAVPMTGGADIMPSKKRGRKNDDDEAKTPTEKKKKRVRKPKNAARAATPSPNEEDEEESPAKKVKVEAAEEDEEDATNGDAEGQEDGEAA